ncbi:hypothetical protein C7121_29160 [Paenibacillus glucanolyticus]|uniref:hypothetical protein n=1 Tax=Paenibacillus TaxID=44249 RepID=UPI0003E1FE97|nr:MULTISPECIES: hypothetical protein [Paenibacillus]ANA81366.1 hypothetical protein A3958_15895 [Paenibacillus glucanolyticus]AVV59904.1 hypothetical protein C7121_29160 [Paenibacillus glucanolyticus]ETT35602.1 FAD-dependent pyridine nucleotide-disulfide oxidoreductase [Paenibacillus sp. FSL R5-808]OMF72191.1 hypothetical protein BK142_20775 [Paenibacillus glucanolyticus]
MKQAVKYGKVVLKKRAVAAGFRFVDVTELKVRKIIWATGCVASMIGSIAKGLNNAGLPWQRHRGSAL